MRSLVRPGSTTSPKFLGSMVAQSAIRAKAEARLQVQAQAILDEVTPRNKSRLEAKKIDADYGTKKGVYDIEPADDGQGGQGKSQVWDQFTNERVGEPFNTDEEAEAYIKSIGGTVGLRPVVEASITAAPPTAKKADTPAAARGDAPQADELSDKAKKATQTKVEGPKTPVEVKPKWLTKEVAQAANQAPPEVQTLYKEVQDLLSKTEANAEALKKFQEGLGQKGIDESIRQKTQLLFDAISKEQMKVLRVGNVLMSADVSNKIISANLSKAETKAIADLVAAVDKHKKAMDEASKKMGEIVQKAFEKSGGSQKQTQRVSFFEGIQTLRAEAKTDEEKAIVAGLVAGLAEMLDKAVNWFKSLFDGLPDLEDAADNLLQAFDAPAVTASATRSGLTFVTDEAEIPMWEGIEEEAGNIASQVAKMVNEGGDKLKRTNPDLYSNMPYLKQGLLETLIKMLEARV